MIKKKSSTPQAWTAERTSLFVYTEKLNANIKYSWCKQICGLRNYKKSWGEFNPCGT